jgi:hypothetical protein
MVVILFNLCVFRGENLFFASGCDFDFPQNGVPSGGSSLSSFFAVPQKQKKTDKNF